MKVKPGEIHAINLISFSLKTKKTLSLPTTNKRFELKTTTFLNMFYFGKKERTVKVPIGPKGFFFRFWYLYNI